MRYISFISLPISCLLNFFCLPAAAGEYLSSAHGDSVSGVSRISMAANGYGVGNCTHCHEQHASLLGVEPGPSGGPDAYALFYSPFISQSSNFCLRCHTGTGGDQCCGGITNRDYSYRAGGWTTSSTTNIFDAFNVSAPATAHNLSDIRTFIDGRWGYTTRSSPCVACHNPHTAQGDPKNSPAGFKTPTSRGYPVSRPSQHATSPWGLWGDDASERINAYTSNYQAPFRYGTTTSYEPDGSTTQDGSNLTDYNTFCTDCHNSTNTIYSSTLGRDLYKIDWSQHKHGTANADGDIDMKGPYNATFGKVLACTDCHEPHGSPNNYLIRAEVNGTALSGTVASGTKDLGYLCRQCHQDDAAAGCGTSRTNYWEYAHHLSGDKPYEQKQCAYCHNGSQGATSCSGQTMMNPIRCTNCHFHGSWVNDPANPQDETPNYSPTTRTTF